LESRTNHLEGGEIGHVVQLAPGAMAFRIRTLGGLFGAALLLLPLSVAPVVGTPSHPLEKTEVVQSRSVDMPITLQEILSKLIERSHDKETQLRQYSVIQSYVVKNGKGHVLAETEVRMQYRAPGAKTFTTQFAKGSRLVQRLVFKQLMEQEARTGEGDGRQASAIGPGNYTFDLLGKEHIDPYDCFVVRAIPRRRDKYLFEGKIWINSEDFGIVKITGHPAQKPSLWVKRVDFVRDYQRVERFWLPLRDNAVAEMRFFGRSTLTIDYANYKLTSGSELRFKLGSVGVRCRLGNP
jgi:hypothetical protein